MLSVYVPSGQCIARQDAAPGEALSDAAVWFDLVNPTREEEAIVEGRLGVELPTREEMQEIEETSRLYVENGAAYMTATVMSRMDTDAPLASPLTFVLVRETLVTIRYAEPRPFASFSHRAQRATSGVTSGSLVMIGLQEAIVDRIADVLETTSQRIDTISGEIFSADPKASPSRDYRALISRLGRSGDLVSKLRESLVSLARLTHFVQEAVDLTHLTHAREVKTRIAALDKDIASLLDQVSFLSGKINFLLDATLGLINIEQNGIIKLFSVVSVALMPPTLIASIYGMNFRHMPELDIPVAYPLALGLMVVSAVLPFVFFKRKGWL